ncbi:Uncharacterized protein YjiK [Lutibacter oricola]|uniref:Uncharacterized protein YjiK n=1 Tax=Lutibacter oricola TaxID=762486 RepID=A0A1H3DQZ6_9FLAO|nr:SdiA-regulated domain-containing protein [Lutibacter oricola]SDX68791.1 Uncharacterized protein YjiK [Lutibacter oricola]
MLRIIFTCFYSIIITGCISNTNSQTNLKLEKVYKLNISEPSGITFYNNHLYIVSDSKKRVYKTNLQGKTIQKIKTYVADNEGVCFNDEGNLVVANESKRRLIEIDLEGKVQRSIKIKGKQKNKNSGLEGVCFVSSEKAYFLLNEKSPKQLLKISSKGKIKEEIKINFCDDLSGICFDEKSNSLWIVSDESQVLMNISLKGKLIKKHKIPVLKAEGVTVVKNKIYIVSDAEGKMYVFNKQ